MRLDPSQLPGRDPHHSCFDRCTLTCAIGSVGCLGIVALAATCTLANYVWRGITEENASGDVSWGGSRGLITQIVCVAGICLCGTCGYFCACTPARTYRAIISGVDRLMSA